MSRRAILWLMALFLGLTGIPMVYCILTWSPPAPLRFRITRDLGTAPSSQPDPFARPLREVEVEVENTRSVTIQLHGATVWTSPDSVQEAPFFGQLDLTSAAPRSPMSTSTGSRAPVASIACGTSSASARSPQTVAIPSHGTRSFRVHVLEGSTTSSASLSSSPSSSQTGELSVQYLWTSQPRHVTGRAFTWLRLHLPTTFHRLIPRLIPDENTTTIQLTSTSPPSATP